MSYQQPPDPEVPQQTPDVASPDGDSGSKDAPIESPERSETDYQTPGGDSSGDDNA